MIYSSSLKTSAWITSNTALSCVMSKNPGIFMFTGRRYFINLQ
jgi:hypothetical protein